MHFDGDVNHISGPWAKNKLSVKAIDCNMETSLLILYVRLCCGVKKSLKHNDENVYKTHPFTASLYLKLLRGSWKLQL